MIDGPIVKKIVSSSPRLPKHELIEEQKYDPTSTGKHIHGRRPSPVLCTVVMLKVSIPS